MTEKPPRRWAGPAIVLAMLLLCASGLGWLFWARNRAMNSPVPAVAVLPFRNLSPGPGSDYFTDGLTIELIDALSRVEKLRVTSWNSASRFRGKAGILPELRDQLHAGAVLNGSLRRDADRVRVTAQLVDTSGGETIWSDTYDRNVKDIFYVQEEIAKSIVYALKVPLRVDPQRILVPPRTDSMEAYDDYLRARAARNPFSAAGLLNSNESAAKAIALDPKYAPAPGLLASNYAGAGYNGVVPGKDAWPKAKTSARTAIELDSTSSEAHAALGVALALGDWDWKGAQAELQRAVQWSPGSAEAHAWLAMAYLGPHAQFEGAEYEARKAVELDPFSFLANLAAGNILLARGKYAESINYFIAAQSIYGESDEEQFNHGTALVLAGRPEESGRQLRKSCKNATDCAPGPAAYALLGDVANGRRSLAETSHPSIEAARAHAVLGDIDEAFVELNGAVDQRDPRVVFVQMDPLLGKLRNDPRFEAILKRLNLQ